MKKTKTNKGITLIALVITIIVMLILVAVTINMAVNGGLFAQAGKAVGDTKNAMNDEGNLLNGKIEIGGTLYNSIEEYVQAPIIISFKIEDDTYQAEKGMTWAQWVESAYSKELFFAGENYIGLNAEIYEGVRDPETGYSVYPDQTISENVNYTLGSTK